MNKKILLIGGGGHCKSVLDTLINNNDFSEVGIIDIENKVGEKVLGTQVIGTDDELDEFRKSGFEYAFVTLGSIGDSSLRIKSVNILKQIGFKIPNIVDQTAIVSKYAELQKGVFVGKNVVINAGSIVGNHAIINTGSIVEHDCSIGEYTHIAPGTTLCGNVKIRENCHIGANTVIRQQIRIGSNTLVGTGSNVVSNIGENKLAYGNPCKEVKR